MDKIPVQGLPQNSYSSALMNLLSLFNPSAFQGEDKFERFNEWHRADLDRRDPERRLALTTQDRHELVAKAKALEKRLIDEAQEEAGRGAIPSGWKKHIRAVVAQEIEDTANGRRLARILAAEMEKPRTKEDAGNGFFFEVILKAIGESSLNQ